MTATKTRAASTAAAVPVTGVPAAPPLPDDLEALLRRLRMPQTRRLAPEVMATAKAQRWEPVEVLRALFAEEVAGRDRSALATRRAAAAFPTGKTFEAWDAKASSIPARPRSRRCARWNGCTAVRTSWSAVRPAPARHSCSKPSDNRPSSKDCASRGSPSKTSACCCAGTAPTTASPRPSPACFELISLSSMTSGFCLLPLTPPRVSTAWWTPPTRNARSRSARTCTRSVRRAHAQDAGHRHRRQAATPRPRLPDQRRIRPALPSTLRPRSDAAGLITINRWWPHQADPAATTGQIS